MCCKVDRNTVQKLAYRFQLVDTEYPPKLHITVTFLVEDVSGLSVLQWAFNMSVSHLTGTTLRAAPRKC